MFVKDRPDEEQTEIKLKKGHGRNKESKRFCEVRVSNNDSRRSHGHTAAWLSEVTPSYWCEISRVTSWFLSVEVDFIWRTNSGMTGLFPWEHICLLCGVQPKCWRGVTNDVLGAKWITLMTIQTWTGSRIPKSFLLFEFPLRFPSNGNLTASSGTSYMAAAGIIFQIIWWSPRKWNEAGRGGNANFNQ